MSELRSTGEDEESAKIQSVRKFKDHIRSISRSKGHHMNSIYLKAKFIIKTDDYELLDILEAY